MKEIKLSAPATIANVGPGFDIFAISLREPRDNFIIRTTGTGEIEVNIEGPVMDLPTTPSENSGSLALIHLLENLGIESGIEITIEKKMPIGSGLGSSGASASAVIYGVNSLLDLGLSFNEMIDYARQGEVASGGSPHADNVAGALLGGFVFIKSYDPMDVGRIEVPEIPLVINVMRKKERTTRGYITAELPLEDIREQSSHCAMVMHCLMKGDIRGFGEAVLSDYISEPVRANAIKGYWDIKRKVLDGGAYGFNISGGGSSVFAVCERDNQDNIARILKEVVEEEGYEPHIIKTVTDNSGVKEIQ